MRQIFLVAFLFLSIISNGQNVDSLENVLNTQKLSADEQMVIYSKLCQSYIYRDADKVIVFARKGIALSEKGKDKTWASKFIDYIGQANCVKAEFDTALVYFNKSLAMAIEANDKEQEACVYIDFGVLFNMQGNITSSLEYYMKALPIYESTGSKKDCAKILSNVASIHSKLKNPERALYYAQQAEEMVESIDDPVSIINTYYILGNIYMDMNELDKGVDYIKRVNELSRAVGNKAYEAASAQALSVYYLYLDDDEKSIEYANESLRIGIEINDRRHIIGAYCTLSDVYGSQEKWKECDSTAYEVWKMIDPKDVHYANGILYKLIFSNIYLDNKDKAADYLSSYKSLFEENNDENFRKILMEMEVKYETEKKEMHIVSLKKERRQYFWLGITGIFLALALGIVLWQKIKNSRKEKQLIATRSVLDGEMGERARLARDLHDRLSGNLSAVKIGLNDHMESLQIINAKLDRCIEEIRHVAHNLMPTSLQHGLKVALEDFAVQFSNVHFHFFGKEKRIEERLEFIAYCCANELITNSVRHSGAKNINVQLVQDDKHVSLTVQDDGCGFDENSASKGFGLKSICDRVASCNGKIDMTLSPGKGTETTIELKTE